MTSLPNTVTGSGQIIVNQAPTPHLGFTQHITGSPIDAAANKTLAAGAQQAAAAKAMGVGQKGSSRKRRMRGGTNWNANIPAGVPEAGTIPGVSHASVHLGGVDNLNQTRANGVYDSFHNATPRAVGGKRSRKVKKNGRSHKRTHKRKHRKHATRHRRTRHVS